MQAVEPDTTPATIVETSDVMPIIISPEQWPELTIESHDRYAVIRASNEWRTAIYNTNNQDTSGSSRFDDLGDNLENFQRQCARRLGFENAKCDVDGDMLVIRRQF